MEKDTGGKAFPLVSPDGIGVNEGMELRDYFAAQALNSIYFDVRKNDEQAEVEDMARLAFKVADAMLVERKK